MDGDADGQTLHGLGKKTRSESTVRVGSTRAVSRSCLSQKCEAEPHSQQSESWGIDEALQA